MTFVYSFFKHLASCFSRAGGTGGAGGAIAPPVFLGERTKIYLDIAAATVAAIHRAPPEFSTSLGPVWSNLEFNISIQTLFK